jgi:hypothetical protein
VSDLVPNVRLGSLCEEISDHLDLSLFGRHVQGRLTVLRLHVHVGFGITQQFGGLFQTKQSGPVTAKEAGKNR